MKLIILATFFAFSTVFLLVNSFSTERSNLFPAAAIFILIGGTLLTGPGIQVQTGTDYNYTTVNNSTVVEQEKKTYTKMQGPLKEIEISQILGLLFIVMGAGYMVMASPGRFKSLLTNN